jgi:hypothetical protein
MGDKTVIFSLYSLEYRELASFRALPRKREVGGKKRGWVANHCQIDIIG